MFKWTFTRFQQGKSTISLRNLIFDYSLKIRGDNDVKGYHKHSDVRL